MRSPDFVLTLATSIAFLNSGRVNSLQLLARSLVEDGLACAERFAKCVGATLKVHGGFMSVQLQKQVESVQSMAQKNRQLLGDAFPGLNLFSAPDIEGLRYFTSDAGLLSEYQMELLHHMPLGDFQWFVRQALLTDRGGRSEGEQDAGSPGAGSEACPSFYASGRVETLYFVSMDKKVLFTDKMTGKACYTVQAWKYPGDVRPVWTEAGASRGWFRCRDKELMHAGFYGWSPSDFGFRMGPYMFQRGVPTSS